MTVLLIGIVLALITAGWVVVPLLFRSGSFVADLVPSHIIDREARRNVAFAALKEIEYDRAAGKLNDADYAQLRGQLELEALEALQLGEGAADQSASGPEPHACGFENPSGSRFCAGCGQRLA